VIEQFWWGPGIYPGQTEMIIYTTKSKICIPVEYFIADLTFAMINY